MLRTDSYASHAAGRSGDPAPDPTPEPLRQAVQAAAGRVDGSKTGEPEQSLLRVLRDHLRSRPDTAAGQPQMLDLRALGPDALALFTPAVARALEQAQGYEVAELVLPPHTRLLPSGIGALRALKKLELPGFTGTQLDLRGLPAGRGAAPLWICTPGAPSLREVLVDSARKATEELRFDLRTTHARRVALVDTTCRRPIAGRAYFREALGREVSDKTGREDAFSKSLAVRLNGKVHFADRSDLITCGHLSLANALRLIAHRQSSSGDEPRPRLDYKSFSTPKGLQAAVPWRLDADYLDFTCRRSRDNHLVAVDCWDAFLRDQASALARGQCRQYLVVSDRHAMHMELQAKPRGADDMDWVVRFYDPNRTASHKRAVLERSGAVPCTLESLLPTPTHIAAYFGSHPRERTALVIGVPDGGMATCGPRDSEDRHLATTYASEGCTPVEVRLRLFHRLHDGVFTRLASALACAQDHFALLMSHDYVCRTPALGQALLTGQMPIAQALLQTALAAAGEGMISGEQLLEVLQSTAADGCSVLHAALYRGHESAAQALLNAAHAAASRKLISGSQLLEVLLGKRTGDFPALAVALHQGHTAAASTLLRAARAAAAEGLISAAQLLEVLHSRLAAGKPALKVALEDGHTPAVQALLESALAAAGEGLISGEQLLEVLQSVEGLGVTALHRALYVGNATAAQTLLQAALTAAGQRVISREQLLQVLRVGQDIAQALAGRLRAPQPPVCLIEGIQVWTGAVLDSPLPPLDRAALLLEHAEPSDGLLAHLATDTERAAANQEPLRRLLEALLPAAGGAGMTGLETSGARCLRQLARCFMAANLPHWVDTLAQCLEASALPSQARADILLALTPSTGQSALSLALEKGNTLAVQAWMRAALALPLPPKAKKSLLSGQPGSSSALALAPRNTFTLRAWAQCIARAPTSQLVRADKLHLLKQVGMSHLLGGAVGWHAAPRGRRGDSKERQPGR